MKRKYFGTDGIRGKVGESPITADFVLKLGWAAGRVLAVDGYSHVIVGKDTRISGYMFESALEAGLAAAGVNIQLLGPMPTPAIAYLTRTFRAQAGIVISASHNPYYDNGIKFFSSEGTKLPDEVEMRIEAQLDQPMNTVESLQLGKASRIPDAAGRYIEFCKSTIASRLDFSGTRIVVDCANGATYHVAPHVLEEIGATVVRIGVSPNGVNINDGYGSTHPEKLRQAVLEHGADLGIAFDGDGDRLIMVDHKGELVDGDELLYIIAVLGQEEGTVRDSVVGTVMSNLGLEQALGRRGLALHRSAVGDRYVMEAMLKHGAVVGGETSGHLICLDKTTTGDGIVAALQVLAALARSGQTLHDLKKGMEKYPQTLLNVRIKQRVDLDGLDTFQRVRREVEKELADRGRILIRPSGTEPLIRIMVEGRDGGQVEQWAQRMADALVESLPA
ncbi:phosphoglucosamine mutase [Methylogaea oryzae]|uniref:Phosphoglucosamine mutase n=1 Tax=Methylogaea oryzae TaxID=1295382 RepID=A0A8D4VP68_9GAMM|nr:phosphoglucosamine mutase [Methylogaea oryzae]BBL71510.1 phosphoglucosamine mutase [Methylogaea oryzae]